MWLLTVTLKHYLGEGVRYAHETIPIVKERETTYLLDTKNAFVYQGRNYLLASDCDKVHYDGNMLSFKASIMTVVDTDTVDMDILEYWKQKLKHAYVLHLQEQTNVMTQLSGEIQNL